MSVEHSGRAAGNQQLDEQSRLDRRIPGERGLSFVLETDPMYQDLMAKMIEKAQGELQSRLINERTYYKRTGAAGWDVHY
ncbi:MAG TPA: hypothetical protein VFH39_03945 [Candidatus Saccharimonadales bacterium]|nr:hypothetical protein [Candidatus Saccharimonadales bacterium]